MLEIESIAQHLPVAGLGNRWKCVPDRCVLPRRVSTVDSDRWWCHPRISHRSPWARPSERPSRCDTPPTPPGRRTLVSRGFGTFGERERECVCGNTNNRDTDKDKAGEEGHDTMSLVTWSTLHIYTSRAQGSINKKREKEKVLAGTRTVHGGLFCSLFHCLATVPVPRCLYHLDLCLLVSPSFSALYPNGLS